LKRCPTILPDQFDAPVPGEFAREYTIEELNKVITKNLPPKAYGKYCGDGGDDLDDKDEILELLSMIDTKLDLKAEVAFLERKENPKLNNSDPYTQLRVLFQVLFI
jgi:hypothetical protein